MNDERELLDLINKTFEKEVKSTVLPQSLDKKSMVAMLKASQTDENKKSKIHSDKIIAFRRFAAVAAVLVVAVAAALVISSSRYQLSSDTNHGKSALEMLSPEAIEEYIIGQINGEENGGGTEPTSSKKARLFSSHRSETETTKSEPTTLIGEETSATKAAATVTRSLGIVRNDGRFIYRLITCTEKGKSTDIIEIISLSALKLEASITLPDSQDGTCFDIVPRGNTLTVLLKKTDSNVSARLYDVTDPASPSFYSTLVQTGTYAYSYAADGKLCLVTNTQNSQPTYCINGENLSVSMENTYSFTNSPASTYSFITVIDLDNLNSSTINYIINGKCDRFSFTGSGLYMSMPEIPASSGVKSACIYRFSLDGDKLKNSGAYNVSGTVCSSLDVTENGSVRFAVRDSSTYSIYILNANMEYIGSASSSYSGKITDVRFGDTFAFISGVSETGVADLSDPTKPTIRVPENASGFENSKNIFSSGTVLVGEGDDGSDGKATWSILTRNGSCTSLSLDSSKFSGDPSRKVVADKTGEITGIPVISGSKPAYLFIVTDTDGSLSAYSLYLYDGNSADSCMIIGQYFYIISENRITAVSVAEILS